MKEINLEIGFTTSLKLDVEKLKAPPPPGETRVLLGTMDVQGLRGEIEIARRNGAQVVWAALEIEQDMEHIISTHMFLPVGINPPRDFFNSKILAGSFFGFAPKKELVREIVHQRELLDGKEKNRLGGLLKKVMDKRNAFAHGHITGMQDHGCVLRYFAGHQREDHLTDGYWDELVSVVIEAKRQLGKAATRLSEQWHEQLVRAGNGPVQPLD